MWQRYTINNYSKNMTRITTFISQTQLYYFSFGNSHYNLHHPRIWGSVRSLPQKERHLGDGGRQMHHGP